MHLKQLYARNFRNFSELTCDFVDGVNVVVGDNAQGKTSLLEALFLCMTASSFRSQHLKELIRHSQEGFFVEASFEKSGITHQVALSYDGEKRRAYLNGTPGESPTVLLGLMPGVASTPDDIAIIKGGPTLRRRFLDLTIAQVDPVFVHHLSRYMRALKQRNALLKQKQVGTMSAWEEELARSSAYIVLKRHAATHFLNRQANELFKALATESSNLELTYSTHIRPQEDQEAYRLAFLQEFDRRRNQEMYVGATLVGPHRDDLHIFIDAKSARDFASIGQSVLAACAMRLAEWHYLKLQMQTKPLMIVDDFGSSLDQTRKKKLFAELSQLGQLFLSSHAPIPNPLPSMRTVFMNDGQICLPN